MYKSSGPEYTINGKTIEVFPFWPNYKRDFIERWEWKTSVLTSFNGDEQRAAIRQYPRRSFEYQVFAQGSDKAALNHFLQAGASTLYGVPDWNWGEMLQPTTTQDLSYYLPISTTGFIADGYIVGFIDPTLYELRKVVAIDGAGVQLDGAVDWPPGTLVHPVIPALLNKEQAVVHTTGLLAEPIISFNCLPSLSPFDASDTPYPVYAGFYVLEQPFEQGQSTTLDYVYKTDTLDNGVGSPWVDIESYSPGIAQPKQWFLNGHDAITNFLRFSHFCAGRLKPFWVPSGTWDAEIVSITGTSIVITDSAYARLVPNKPHRQHLRITSAFSTYYRKIVSSASGGDLETLTLDTSLPITASEVTGFSFLWLVRFDADRIEVAYMHASLAKAVTPVRTLNHDI
ncbi:hypothetical protein [Methylovulum miyakonense]|uniref:hypothetical protein n=1 Tax=Methylovulum miyakonense TaxID=645578 RepID=UPI00035DA5DA|nr:hypothetical protein [Methylovulum miyakonense]